MFAVSVHQRSPLKSLATRQRKYLEGKQTKANHAVIKYGGSVVTPPGITSTNEGLQFNYSSATKLIPGLLTTRL